MNETCHALWNFDMVRKAEELTAQDTHQESIG